MLQVKPITRSFIAKDFILKTWDNLEPYMKDLAAREINSLDEYQQFLTDEDELGRILEEDGAWRYIKMSCDTSDKAIEESYNYFIQNISPKLSEYADVYNRKIAESPFALQIKDSGFALTLKGIKSSIEIFRAKNIPLQTQEEQLGAEVIKVHGAMTVTLDGEEMTLQRAGDYMFLTDRAKREEAWKAIGSRRYQDHEKLDEFYSQQVALRHKIALNADFENYRDYVFKNKHRYDYTPQDCFTFHDAIEKAVMPVVKQLQQEQADALGLEKLRPWDGAVDPQGRPPLKAFESADDLVTKSLQLYKDLDPLFHDTVQIMKDHKKLDLASRLNKRPGGYNYPLCESKVPFIFANVTSKVDDLVTFIHEVGHATQEIAMRDLRLMSYASIPSEVAELASMSMELLTMDQWDIFFPKEEDLRRAKLDHLEKTISILPWIALVDAFQHDVYEKPDLTAHDRLKMWSWQQKRFSTDTVDWTGFADLHETQWHRQLHIFDMPFYYIEYAMAQLGALQVWRNFKQDKKQALEQYKNALALGYTKSIPEIYETAGIKFDFSAEMLKDLMAFVQKEMALLI
jgi:oligoendopeptidase F